MTDEQMEVLQDEVLSADGSTGADVSAAEGVVLDNQETVMVDHVFYTTPFTEYTVSEGLLLLIFVILLVNFFLDLLRRWF